MPVGRRSSNGESRLGVRSRAVTGSVFVPLVARRERSCAAEGCGRRRSRCIVSRGTGRQRAATTRRASDGAGLQVQLIHVSARQRAPM